MYDGFYLALLFGIPMLIIHFVWQYRHRNDKKRPPSDTDA